MKDNLYTGRGLRLMTYVVDNNVFRFSRSILFSSSNVFLFSMNFLVLSGFSSKRTVRFPARKPVWTGRDITAERPPPPSPRNRANTPRGSSGTLPNPSVRLSHRNFNSVHGPKSVEMSVPVIAFPIPEILRTVFGEAFFFSLVFGSGLKERAEDRFGRVRADSPAGSDAKNRSLIGNRSEGPEWAVRRGWSSAGPRKTAPAEFAPPGRQMANPPRGSATVADVGGGCHLPSAARPLRTSQSGMNGSTRGGRSRSGAGILSRPFIRASSRTTVHRAHRLTLAQTSPKQPEKMDFFFFATN